MIVSLEQERQAIENFISTTPDFFSPAHSLTSRELVNFLCGEIFLPLYHGRTVVIALNGGPGSGKTTLARDIASHLTEIGFPTDILQTDDFNLLDRKGKDSKIAEGTPPHACKDFDLLKRLVMLIREGKPVYAPRYESSSGEAIDRLIFDHLIPGDLNFLIVEGDFPAIDDPNYSIYFHVNSEARLRHRVKRDTKERGFEDEEAVVASFQERQVTQFLPYTLPLLIGSDMVIFTDAFPSNGNGRHDLTYSHDVYQRP